MTRKMPEPWVHEETRWLRRLARRGKSLREIAETMGRDRSVIRERAKRHGVEIVRLCVKTRWSDAEDAVLRARYADTEMRELLAALPGRTEGMVYNRAHALGLAKAADFMREVHGARLREFGPETRFRKGQPAWNKGLRGNTGTHANCQRTQFKPGALPHTWRPIGHERITRDGVLEIKVRDTRCTRHDYESVARLVWERERGPIPAGHLVVFRKGLHTTQFRDITAERLDCISPAENMRRNSRHTRYPPEVNRLIQLKGALNRKIRNREKEREQ